MTSAEISKHLKLAQCTVSQAVKRAAEYTESIKKKFVNGSLWFCTEFTLEETKIIFKELNATDFQIILMEENWKETVETDVITIKGTNRFLSDFEKDPYIQCCNTCKYLVGKVTTKMPRPFCSLYNKFLESFNANVYEDWCSSYCYLELPKARRWYKDNAPINLNMFGEIGTINGINNEDLQKHRRNGDPVIHVNQIDFDI